MKMFFLGQVVSFISTVSDRGYELDGQAALIEGHLAHLLFHKK